MNQIDIMKAVADENRIRILNLVRQREVCVCELDTLLELNQSNVSRHLSKLRHCGIIRASKEAQWVHYAVEDAFKEEHEALWSHLEGLFETHPVCREDSKRLKRYLAKGLTCQDIREDAEAVLEAIRLEDGVEAPAGRNQT